MRKQSSLFLLAALIFLSSMIILVSTGMHQISQEEFYNFRLQQVKEADLQSDRGIQPVTKIGSVIVSDFFNRTEEGYRYHGGVYGGWWEVGKTYNTGQLNSGELLSSESHTFLNFLIHDNCCYINIDRGDESAVKEFLTIMDQYGQNGIDTLILDFRFIQTIDFSAIIRLFNQLAPQYRLTFGTIINEYQEEEIKSSGKPFFSIPHTIILVDTYMPEPVKFMIRQLSILPSYELIGDSKLLADTICLETKYTVGADVYKVCTDKLTGLKIDTAKTIQVTTVPDSTMMVMLEEIDNLWYKKRDTSSVKKHLITSITTLLP